MTKGNKYFISSKLLKTKKSEYFFKRYDEKIGQFVFTNGNKWFTIKLENRHRYTIRRAL